MLPAPSVAKEEKRRARMRAYLGRYGHQSMLQWDNVPVIEVEALQDAVSDIVKEEKHEKPADDDADDEPPP